MVNKHQNNIIHTEQLPQNFEVKFEEIYDAHFSRVKVTLNNEQAGDVIDDNSFIDDGYRYHDIFHYTFATLLDWSPCTRSMLKRKRKSDSELDRIEDGARAAITEECISLMIFNDAKINNYYLDKSSINPFLLDTIKIMTENLEVSNKSKEEWNYAILKSYEMFRLLYNNKGGIVYFDTDKKEITYKNLLN
ncbi:nucleotide pyrophosphohydrolase [Empedobacter brevis]|uniref:Nucleotide pyrophosphohydrolase n=1 Tax=Empedobacter brevis TaxID=247 RepID=A0AAJ1QDX7_9FLAO|nr:nucleotide pyrophosphohydrolase [Empedobacter brevis]MDM1072284.1 nucleotide pyrophosphohydrolase [Empedobacter brevis]